MRRVALKPGDRPIAGEELTRMTHLTILEPKAAGRARHSVRAGLRQTDHGAHGVTRPTFTPLKKNVPMPF